MNKTELITALASETGLTKTVSKTAVEGLFKVVKQSLKEENVTIAGFGTWKVIERNARFVRNPKTQEQISVPAKKIVRFKVGTELLNSVK